MTMIRKYHFNEKVFSLTKSLKKWSLSNIISKTFNILLVILMANQISFAQVHSTIRVSGKHLVDINGDRIIARGVENSFGIGLSEDGRFIDEIAKTGANAIRILPNLADGQLTLSQVDALFAKAKSYGMVIYISPGGLAVPGGSTMNEECWKWFERDDVYNMLQKYKEYIVIDAIQEQSHNDENIWTNDCKTAIDRMRRRGYEVPLLMMSSGYGRSHTTVINKAQEVFNYDPLKNTFFNVQAYWDQNWDGPKKWSTQLIQERLAELDQLSYAVQIGVCPWAEGAPCDNGYVDYKTAMAECQKYGMGWLVWEWHNPYEWSKVFQLTTNGNYGSWANHCTWDAVYECRDDGVYGCDYGYQVAVGHAASIQKTSVKTCFFNGDSSCSGGGGGGTDLRNPDSPSNTVGGLNYEYYEGTWSTLPNFNNLTSIKTGSVSNFDLSVRNRNDNFGFRYTGYIDVPNDGSYTFYTSSDDGSKLYIGSTEVVNNDGLHASQERSGSIGLKAGKHAITVTFFEATGGEVLEVRYSGPNVSKQLIPNSRLSRTSSGGGGGGGTVTGDIVREYWTGISGNSISQIPLSTSPSGTSVLTSFEGPTNWADNYGTRIRGYIVPATSGSYTFYLSSDDDSELWLSTNDSPGNKRRIANVTGWTSPREWNKYSSQRSASISLTAGTKYYVEVLHKEGGGGDNVAVGWTGPGYSSITVVPGSVLSRYEGGGSSAQPSGYVVREYWTGVGGTSVSQIPLSQAPSGTQNITSIEGPTNWGTDYGTRIRGYIVPSQSGNYTFYVASDDNSELYLSTNDSPGNKQKIAEVLGWTNSREWNKYASQQSSQRSLTAGQWYYFEVLHKEANGGDNIAVGWTGPGVSTITVVGSSNISHYTGSGSRTAFEPSKKSSEERDNDLTPIAIYPNPTNDNLTVNFGSEKILRASITNILGHKLDISPRHNGSEMVFDLKNQPAGMYLLILEKEDAKNTYRIIKR